jgi:uncharacterized sulfatase
MLDVVLGIKAGTRKAPLFWCRPPDRSGTTAEPNPDLAVRHGKWKLLCRLTGAPAQLYDLNTDISETDNVVEDDLHVRDRLRSAVLGWKQTLPVDGVAGLVVER